MRRVLWGNCCYGECFRRRVTVSVRRMSLFLMEQIPQLKRFNPRGASLTLWSSGRSESPLQSLVHSVKVAGFLSLPESARVVTAHGRMMSSFVCRVQFLDDTDPFNSTSFPEPTRPPVYTFREDIPLINQLAGIHRLLKAPHKVRKTLHYTRELTLHSWQTFYKWHSSPNHVLISFHLY